MFINEIGRLSTPSEVRRELTQFYERDGARMFAPKEEFVLVNSDGEDIV
jgi:hypothetical protein